MKTFKYIFFLSVIVISGNALAQDFHFSQFNENSAMVNPALTGNAGVLRANVVYRDQWKSVTVPYKTYGFAVETKFKSSSWQQVPNQSMTFTKKSFSRLTAGLSFYSDKAGDGNLRTTQINLSLASHVPINKKNSLSVGLQGSLVQRKIDFANLIFSNQFNGIAYDAAMASGEKPGAMTFIYPDVSAGLSWIYMGKGKSFITSSQKKANVGAALYHINRPRQSFLATNNEKINFKYVLHGDFLLVTPNSNIAFAPSYLIQLQNTSHEVIAGASIKYFFKEDAKYTGYNQSSSFGIGGYYRYGDAIILALNYDKNQQFGIGISYDLNVSGLTRATKIQGGPEITLRYNAASPYLYQKRTKF